MSDNDNNIVVNVIVVIIVIVISIVVLLWSALFVNAFALRLTTLKRKLPPFLNQQQSLKNNNNATQL